MLYFWNQLLRPGELASASLPLVALIAGIAATFNPCGLPALPGFITLLGGNTGDAGVRQRLRLSLGASLGAMSLVLALGIIVAIVGSGTKGLIAPYFRWVQLAVGLFLVGLASLHMTDQTSRLPPGRPCHEPWRENVESGYGQTDHPGQLPVWRRIRVSRGWLNRAVSGRSCGLRPGHWWIPYQLSGILDFRAHDGFPGIHNVSPGGNIRPGPGRPSTPVGTAHPGCERGHHITGRGCTDLRQLQSWAIRQPAAVK